MKADEAIDIFRQADAILEGHFVLSSGRHSPVFLQKARVFMYPDLTERLCKGLADAIRAAGHDVELVVSPALGGLIPGYETARQLGVPAIWVEREGGEFQLRRGFEIAPGTRIAIVEDIVTTGLSSRETVDCVRALGGNVLCCACLIDRSNGQADPGVPLVSLAAMDVPSYAADEVPPELAAIAPTKPGSRHLSGGKATA
ncbi:MAG: orotate phosphoribosyltransferase [Rhodobiaceae bacterium]|nr:orotate phosphoribosyltransferase [Rhodobiaceae bacterium]MCC0016273.1 orotate phosphoribosyltransferase [Rhodobiaceae bacterium]MCC0041636.1 orotate phosphoribosyltransferase [Rhodobiaceae bacterium]MCC0052615.1 orotate phosphoribosyltransferase [Rhodobiaceae bacterium]